MLPKEWDCPFDDLVTQRLGAIAHGGTKDVLKFLIPNGGAISPAMVCQGGGIAIALKALDPMIDGHSTGPQQSRDLYDRTPAIDFEDREDTAEHTRISSGS